MRTVGLAFVFVFTLMTLTLAEETVDFKTDIEPILSKRCWSCHGEKKQESGLRLDRRAAALAGGDGGQIIVAGKSEESRLIQYVTGTDPDKLMPPEGEPLTPQQIAKLRAWIDQGATWPESGIAEKNPHWAYQSVKVAPLPNVAQREWIREPLDAYILAELEKRGLSPSPEADRYTQIRRLYFDLLGLLPPVEEVDAFLNDQRPAAYEALIDRLLASPHFGERWGRHWLDMARYADSDGYEKDNARPDAYLWRDWVIDAINADMPFDQFTIEQLAGDLLPNATMSQRLATAFHRQTLTNTEGGTDQEQFRVEACFDRTETTGAVWMGLTVGCARCHSHKYDAISQREYYQLFAIFNNGDEQTMPVPKSAAEIARYARDKAAHDAAVMKLTMQLRAAQDELQPEFTKWQAAMQEQAKQRVSQPVKLHALEDAKIASDDEVTFVPQPDGSVLASGPNPATAVYTVTGTAAVGTIDAIRLDVLPDPSLPAQGPGRVAHGNYVLTECRLEVASKADFSDVRPLDFASGKADFEQADGQWPAKNTFDGKSDTGWAIAPQFGKTHWLVLRLKEPLVSQQPLYVRVRLEQHYGQQHTIGRFKLSLQTGLEAHTDLPAAIAKILALSEQERSAAQRQQLLDHYSNQHPKARDLAAKLAALKKKEPPKPEFAARIFVQRMQSPRQTFVLKRGEFLQPIQELEVSPAALATLPPLSSREPGQPVDRLDFARWLVSPQHPLTPRVTANHVWRLLFGQGLVRTPNDFGVRGEPPTHPELLDWLAAELVKQNWSRKALIKRIVMSATYRQASDYRQEVQERDPQNLWLARQNRWRTEGEVLGDISLDAAGLLSRKIGGPSVYPPLPPGIAELSYAGNFKWNESNGADRYRRGMYTFFKRTAPHPNLTLFDCPDANLTCIERRTSNTPLQALATLNNASFAESAQALSRRVLEAHAADDAGRLTLAFRQCLARPPREAELRELQTLLAASRAWYREHSDAAKPLVGGHITSGVSTEEQAAWVATLRILLNLDEFVTRE
jgi:hypothetical protein